MYREVNVYLHQRLVGFLRQFDDGYEFEYLADYQGRPLSLSLPVAQRKFYAPTLFPYFKSLCPEGWLKERYCALQKIDEQDLFGLLANNGKNLIGAVSVLVE